MLQITKSTSPKEISDHIAKLREQKGKEKDVLSIIQKSLSYGHGFVVNLLWEQALTYQHLLMNEKAKGESGNPDVINANLRKMEETVNLAKYYIVRFDLDEWKHRLFRFLGRVSDYKGDFKRAANYYRKSIRYSKYDPDYTENRFPRYLEVEAFLSYSLIMGGQVGKGHAMAEELFKDFDTNRDAKELKKKDLATWLIWKTGIPIRTVNALIDRKVLFNKKDATEWLMKAEKDLNTAKGKKLWADLKYRREELDEVKKRLSSVNS